jgi:hypothetical protein
MIYNLVEYLRGQFPLEKFYCNLKNLEITQTSIPDRIVIVNETGGNEMPYFLYVKQTAQIRCRDFDVTKTHRLAWAIFKNITSRFGLILSAVTVDGVVFPAIQTAQISAIQLPQNMGVDAEGRTEFVNNYEIIYRR